jgi:competence protein ComEC
VRNGYFYTLVVGVVVGAILAPFLSATVLPIAIWLGLVGLLLLLVGYRGGGFIAAPMWLLYLPLFLLALSCILVRVALTSPLTVPSLEANLDTTVTLEGVVIREPDMRERSLHLYVQTDMALLLVTTDRLTSVSYGDRVAVSGKLTKPEAFATDLGRTFNYPGYLAAKGVGYTLQFADVSVRDVGQGNPVVAALLTAKHIFMAKIEERIPLPQVGLAEGLLLGVKQALGPEYETAFRETGIMHIVVLSGYNVMLVVTFFMYVLAYVLPYRLRLVTGMLGIIGFALLVGLSATVVRACLMASLLLCMRFGGMTHNMLRALFVAGMAMLLANPLLLLYDIGFQLSFLATFALIVFAPYVERWFQAVPTCIGIREFLIATVTTQLFVTPLIMYHTGEVSLVAVLVNVLVLPMVAVAMLLTFATGMVAFVSTALAVPGAYLAYLSLSYILYVATTVARLPFASVAIPPFSVGYLFLLYTGVGIVWWYVMFYKKVRQREHAPADPLATWTIVEET